ncbi:unnamed protein product [Leuciscus chuanchicus]
MAGAGEAVEATGLDYNARFDGIESKLNKLLQVNTSTNTLLDSAVKRIEALETRFESAMAEVHDYGVLVEAQLELKEEDFERAHHVGAKRHDTGYPRAIIFKLHHYQKKLYIWKGTRRQIEGCNFKVVPDMSVAVREKRKAFWPLREQLHQIDIKTFLKFPATLYVEDGDLVNTFTSPEKARLELKKKYPK